MRTHVEVILLQVALSVSLGLSCIFALALLGVVGQPRQSSLHVVIAV